MFGENEACDHLHNRSVTRHAKAVAKQAANEDSDEIDDRVFTVDAENGLSWEKVQVEIDRKHPRRFNDATLEYEPWPLLKDSNFGRFSFRPNTRKSGMAEYGPGVVLYF